MTIVIGCYLERDNDKLNMNDSTYFEIETSLF